jgi:hypothetical protein
VGIGVRPEHIVDAPTRSVFHRAGLRKVAVCAAAVLAVAGVCLLGKNRRRKFRYPLQGASLRARS